MKTVYSSKTGMLQKIFCLVVSVLFQNLLNRSFSYGPVKQCPYHRV